LGIEKGHGESAGSAVFSLHSLSDLASIFRETRNEGNVTKKGVIGMRDWPEGGKMLRRKKKVNKTGCISIEGMIYGIGLDFIGCMVDVSYSPADLTEIYVKCEGHALWKARGLAIWKPTSGEAEWCAGRNTGLCNRVL
jgi:hypothetical protein